MMNDFANPSLPLFRENILWLSEIHDKTFASPVGLLMMTIYICPNWLGSSLPPPTARHSLPPLGNAINWKLIIIIMNSCHDDWIWSFNIFFFFRLLIEAVCLFFCHQIVISLRAERRRREVRREKFTHKNCTLPTIHLGPAGQRPAWA